MEKELSRRNYSLRTIELYSYCLNKFLDFVDKDVKKITKQDIKEYLDKLVNKKVSGSTINVYLNSLKFLFEEILNKKLTIKIKYSKIPKTLPVFLSKEEVVKLINNIKNNKHKLMIKLLYSAGFRVSELLHLKVENMDFENNYGWVKKGKGNKDRLFILASSLKNELLNYIKENNLDYDSLIFTSYNGQMSARSIQEIIKKAAKKSKINKKVHPHTLRHSFATHLLEDGYDLTSVQSLLGHNSLETTMIYLHITPKRFINVKSPLDGLELAGNNKNLTYEENKIEDMGFISQGEIDLRI
jgi:site-specific recombinase XerD